jgi:Trypsin-like peptidase domain
MHQSGMRLNEPQKEQFKKALLIAFEVNEFDDLLDTYLQIKRRDLIIEYNMGRKELYKRVIEAIDRQGYTPELLDAVLKERPKDKQLFAFAQQFDVPVKLGRIAQERITYPENHYVDADPWLERLIPILSQVCSIEKAGKHIGTGFLIGPCIIITNYHVVEALFLGNCSSTDIICRFDCRIKVDGTVRTGVQHRLAEEGWEIHHSPYHPLEFSTPDVEPSLDQLDFALLRLEDTPANYQSPQDTLELSKRGWIKPYLKEYRFMQNTSLNIAHYPKPPKYKPGVSEVPLKISIDSRTVLDENKNRTRVRYCTNTEPGSSGSPCFTQNWELVALHHAGDPTQEPQYNQGIPLLAILRKLAIDEKLHFLNLDATAISEFHLTSLPLPNDNDQILGKGNSPFVSPQSTASVIAPTPLMHQVKSVLEAIEANIEEARKPFADEGNKRDIQYTFAFKKLQNVKTHLQMLSALIDDSHQLPLHFPDRETLDTDISIAKTDCEILIQLLRGYKSCQDIQNGFSNLNNSFCQIKKAISEKD